MLINISRSELIKALKELDTAWENGWGQSQAYFEVNSCSEEIKKNVGQFNSLSVITSDGADYGRLSNLYKRKCEESDTLAYTMNKLIGLKQSSLNENKVEPKEKVKELIEKMYLHTESIEGARECVKILCEEISNVLMPLETMEEQAFDEWCSDYWNDIALELDKVNHN